jgi:retron-type reverse transcriptase
VVTILNQIYEVDFKGFSYGFRPGRSPHQALDALAVGIQWKQVWVLDADIRGFFDFAGPKFRDSGTILEKVLLFSINCAQTCRPWV